MTDCKVPVMAGRNAWLIVRTDRDGASESEVLQSAVAFLQQVLGEPLSPFEVVTLPGSTDQVAYASLGKARPVVVTAERGDKSGFHNGAALPGQLMGRGQDCDPLPHVKATRPWWVRVGFDWRGSDEWRDWPMLRVSGIGMRSWGEPEGNDWLLVEARFVGPETGEDVQWLAQQVQGVKGIASDAVAPLLKLGSTVVWVVAGAAAAAAAVMIGIALAKRPAEERTYG